ncbi:MAG: Nitrogenase molybdenum-iron protein alpha/beta chain NifD [Candidatus Methanohalarchaeum thermophilum]|uniref:Nitrogenase molybdenum-iron protein alpha/beta chain NifD n=1 Tax=Methanohalarchaeum thermophilum TaxID=1903181 RepID=A0A1Q6DVS0_METT1|nr:MAG: Nitrogenase molybdenum-iron protein alpha/beta chain NifD [Candidatus Methanohalarchaeum thermophilum]
MEDKKQIIHPRPSSIVAAMYTLRDLEVDVIILHGPPGCSFKHSRLMEEEGVKVLTSSMGENDFVFGAEEKLVDTINTAIKEFKPNKIGVVGTCASMIIGEDLSTAIEKSRADIPILEVEVHSGIKDNTEGVIRTLESAEESGWITEDELNRQKRMLNKATEIEKKFGAAMEEYIEPRSGDNKYTTAKEIYRKITNGKQGIIVLNAKKETSYVFVDILAAINEVAVEYEKQNLTNIANIDTEIGLPKTRKDAQRILNQLNEENIDIDHVTGGLDEYPVTGKKAKQIIEKKDEYDFLVIIGLPHALNINEDKDIFSVTNGPREVKPLKDYHNHDYVVLEKDLHTKSMGKRSIVRSELGETLREIHAEEK